MSQSLLHHAFGVREGWKYRRTAYVEGRVEFTVEADVESISCPSCQSYDIVLNGKRERRLRTVPIGNKPVFLVAQVPRCLCKQCGKDFEVSPPLPSDM